MAPAELSLMKERHGGDNQPHWKSWSRTVRYHYHRVHPRRSFPSHSISESLHWLLNRLWYTKRWNEGRLVDGLTIPLREYQLCDDPFTLERTHFAGLFHSLSPAEWWLLDGKCAILFFSVFFCQCISIWVRNLSLFPRVPSLVITLDIAVANH